MSKASCRTAAQKFFTLGTFRKEWDTNTPVPKRRSDIEERSACYSKDIQACGQAKLPDIDDKKIAEARANGKKFLIVCVDALDRLRGDRDLGYYYASFNLPSEVAAFIRNHATGDWGPIDIRDYCTTVIELKVADRAIVHDPETWLAALET
ncbi:hypothetical protein [uncultured Jannaschia sp.]|uniref:hypothetical protein n=1 Tax=uncultured Jannaschia sp. TaxID=293347 RepID=UPI00262D37B1|nr:hypothetical protein [uncultured Jannaschia sp.]